MRFTDSLVLPLSDRQDSNLRATVPKTVEINLTPLLPVIRSPPRIRTSILWTKTICPAVRRGENKKNPSLIKDPGSNYIIINYINLNLQAMKYTVPADSQHL